MPKSEEKRYLIGEVSRITGIPCETLRYYDREGIISPKYVDPSNNYRYYTYDQFWCFDLIVCYKRLGVPLDRISEILRTNDNDQVLQLLQEQYDEAVRLSDYYATIAADIKWYADQSVRMKKTQLSHSVVIKHYPARRVFMASNAYQAGDYHLKLQELCREAGQPRSSLRRYYGFVLDKNGIEDDRFIKRSEYIQFENMDMDAQAASRLTEIPEGDYACFVQKVVNDKADFSLLRDWFAENGESIEADYNWIISDEIGLQLFQYLDSGYLCETKVLLKK